jgi:hypothetical protein
MAEDEAAQVDEAPETSGGDVEAAGDGMADAVDDRAAKLTGAAGAAATDSPVASNSDPVAQAEAHLEETDLAEDRDTLKKLQSQM